MTTTAALCGMGGVVTGAGAATEITNWQITRTIDLQDATSFASAGFKERVGCLKGATGTFNSIGSKSLAGLTTGVAFKTAAAGGFVISGNVIITKAEVVTDVNGLITYAHNFVFTGAVTAS